MPAKSKLGKTDDGLYKRPLSAYMLFANGNRSKIIDELTSGGKCEDKAKPSIGEIGKESGARWGKMNDAAKKPYNDDNEQLKAQYAALDEDQKKPSKAKGAKGGVGKKDKVKRPPSAYNLFMKAELPKWKAKNPTKDHKEAFTAVAQLWSKNKK